MTFIYVICPVNPQLPGKFAQVAVGVVAGVAAEVAAEVAAGAAVGGVGVTAQIVVQAVGGVAAGVVVLVPVRVEIGIAALVIGELFLFVCLLSLHCCCCYYLTIKIYLRCLLILRRRTYKLNFILTDTTW